VDGDEAEAHELVEAERADVVVGGDEPEAAGARARGGCRDGGDQRTADAPALVQGGDGDELAGLAVGAVAREADALAALLGDEARELRQAV
jgi:hypothetical protein